MKYKRTISFVLMIAMLITFCLPTGAAAQPYYDGTASNWAVPELQAAEKLGLTYSGVMGKFTTPITREEFCMVVMKLYEKLSKKTVNAGENPFTDTANPEIIKANQLGIVLGTGNGQFSPNASITRQELCVMIYRALQKALPETDMTAQSTESITDESQIANWAKAQVRFCIKNKIIQGVGGGNVNPLGKTTREQGIAIIKRTYTSFATSTGADTGDIGTGDVNIPGLPDDNAIKLQALYDAARAGKGTATIVTLPEADQKSKFEQIDFDKRIVAPKYNTKINLYAATTQNKPTALPKNGNLQGQYTASADGCFVDINGSHKRYFAFDNMAPDAVKVVWQVSKVPFNGSANKWKTPGGLLATGEVAASAREFAVDFGKYDATTIASAAGKQQQDGTTLANANNGNASLTADLRPMAGTSVSINKVITPVKPKVPPVSVLGLSMPDQIQREQRDFYVRAVPVNSAGECIGDPGTGLHVLYGTAKASNQSVSAVSTSFELWTLQNSGQSPIGTPEFRNYFDKQGETTVAVYGGTADNSYQWRNLKAKASGVVLQVSTKPMPNVPASWDKPAGLVYSKTYTDLSTETPYKSNMINANTIVFSDFSPTLQPKEKIEYYVRAVALVESEEHPGVIEPLFSNTIKTIYMMPEPIKLLTPKTILVPTNSPDVTGFKYVPIDWEDPEWLSYYQVSRTPQPAEVTFKVVNKNTGMVLLPYATAKLYGISDAAYKQTLETMLPVGAVIKVVPKKEDKSWWGDLWDSIYNFFKSIVNTIAGIVNWVSTLYEDLKTTVVSAVASCLAVVNSDWKDAIETGLMALLNTGLAAMGIPPTIPNFDKLCDEGLDYAVKTALQEAGVPADELSVAATKEVVGLVSDEIKKSGSKGSPNPLGNCPFLRVDPGHQYQPAYVEFTLTNNKGVNSPNGFISLSVWSGNYPSYPVFHDKTASIPALQPGESTKVIIYLEEYHDAPYPGGGIALPNDFKEAYWADGYYTDPFGKPTSYKPAHFNISLGYNVPEDVRAEAHKQGLDNIPNKENYILSYQYDGKYKSLSFEGRPYEYKYGN